MRVVGLKKIAQLCCALLLMANSTVLSGCTNKNENDWAAQYQEIRNEMKKIDPYAFVFDGLASSSDIRAGYSNSTFMIATPDRKKYLLILKNQRLNKSVHVEEDIVESPLFSESEVQQINTALSVISISPVEAMRIAREYLVNNDTIDASINDAVVRMDMDRIILDKYHISIAWVVYFDIQQTRNYVVVDAETGTVVEHGRSVIGQP